MADAGTDPDAWQEVCRVGIIVDGGSEVQFAALTEDISGLDFGDKDIEGMATLSGGRLVKQTPQADESVTLKVYPIDVLLDGNGVAQYMHPQSTAQTTSPAVVDNTLTRNKHGIIMLWAETLPATAGTTPAASKTAYRIQIRNAYMTSYKPDYGDKVFSAEVTFKWTPFDKNGSANKREESTDGSTQLAAAMTTATSF